MTDDQGTLWKQPIEARLWHGCHYLALESTGFKPKETRSLMVSIAFFFSSGLSPKISLYRIWEKEDLHLPVSSGGKQ